MSVRALAERFLSEAERNTPVQQDPQQGVASPSTACNTPVHHPEAPSGGKILLFPTRPTGTPHRLYLTRDHSTDAVKGGEPCPTCQRTDWRLVSHGLWLCLCGRYWSPSRQVEKSDPDPAQPSTFETGSRS